MNRREILLKGFQRAHLLRMDNPVYWQQFERYIIEAVASDVSGRDITTESIFRPDMGAAAEVRTRQPCIVAGTEEAFHLYRHFGITAEVLKSDGSEAGESEVIFRLNGPVKSILAVERMALELLSRMCGIATTANKLAGMVQNAGSDTMVAATRKTLWGMLDKKAVAMGGGLTHRLNLNDAVLIKDNHLAELEKMGSIHPIRDALEKAMDFADVSAFIEIEVESKEEAVEAAEMMLRIRKRVAPDYPLAIMLDNFSPEGIRAALTLLQRRSLIGNVLIEASGGINEMNIAEYARTGVDAVSLGYITCSPETVDIKQKIIT